MSRLAPFLLASAALHAALLAGGVANQSLSAGAEIERIAVLLDGDNKPALPRPASRNSQYGSTVADTNANATDPVMTTTHANSSVAPATDLPRPLPAHDNASARVQAQVLQELTRYFYYPAQARRQGWEGRVLLAFHVEQNGQLRDPRVVRTSGFGVLDDAALNSLRKVERVADAGGVPLDMQIPVVYRLMDER